VGQERADCKRGEQTAALDKAGTARKQNEPAKRETGSGREGGGRAERNKERETRRNCDAPGALGISIMSKALAGGGARAGGGGRCRGEEKTLSFHGAAVGGAEKLFREISPGGPRVQLGIYHSRLLTVGERTLRVILRPARPNSPESLSNRLAIARNRPELVLWLNSPSLDCGILFRVKGAKRFACDRISP